MQQSHEDFRNRTDEFRALCNFFRSSSAAHSSNSNGHDARNVNRQSVPRVNQNHMSLIDQSKALLSALHKIDIMILKINNEYKYGNDMKNSGNRYNNSIKHIKHELRTVKSAIYKYNAQLKSINFHNRSSLQEHFNVIQSSLINTACRMEKILNDMADVQANIINNQSHSDGTNIGVEKQDPNYIKATQKSVIGRKNIDQRYSSQIDEESMAFPDEQEQQQQQQQKQETMPTVQMKGLMYNNAAAMINDNLSDFTEITNRFQQLGQNHEQLNQIIAEQAETIVRIDDYVHNANVNLVNTRSELLNFMAEQVKDRCFVVKLVVIISIFFIIYLKMAK